jgi:EmrB/QacA subfamily drug resistance transporter
MKRPSRHKDVLLAVVCVAQFMVLLDIAIVNVALPSISIDLGFSQIGAQWIVNIYTLTFAGLLMLGGRSGDLFGRRRVLLVGTAWFAVASLCCALASSQGELVAARAAQGAGAAIVSPATLATVTAVFASGHERDRALGIWSAVGSLGGASGVLIGGILTEALGWASIFFLNVPLALVVLALGWRVLPHDHAAHPDREFDFAGALLITGGLGAIVFGIVRTDAVGWASPQVLGPLAGGFGLLVLFALVEGKFARDPLIPLDIFRQPLLRAACLVIGLLYAGFFSIWFFLSLFLQRVQHLGPLRTGLAFLPLTLAVVVSSTLATRLIRRFGRKPVLVAGMLCASIGLLMLTQINAGDSYLVDVFPGAFLTSFGFGLALVSSTIIGTRDVPMERAGLASALLNTSRLVGGTVGIAALSTFAVARSNSLLGAGESVGVALTGGYRIAFLLGALTSAAGTLVAALLIRRGT